MRVRKHRAPKVALRLRETREAQIDAYFRQKAPIAKRCIKTETRRQLEVAGAVRVRKHRAPNGALRQATHQHLVTPVLTVRKHRAPNGALRREVDVELLVDRFALESTERHKVH